MAFFAELKRRRVFRVALVYAGAAWAMAQVADVLEPVLNLPEWTVPMVLFLLILGFPIAMVLAWAFDIGPSGIETTQAITKIGPVRVAIYMGLLLVATAAMVLLIKPQLLFGDRDDTSRSTRPASSATGVETPYDSVAVLPFENLSDDPSNDHIGSGIAEEMRHSLSRVPGLRVAARTSSLAMRDTSEDVRQVGQQLGVSTIILGTVRGADDDIRITAQLIDAETGFQLWSEAYDRKVTDLIAIQRDISRQILEDLQGEMPAILLERITSSLTDDLEAYDYYLRGRALTRQRSFADSTVPLLREAIVLYERAIEEDPEFAEAHGALAEALMALSQIPGQENSEQAVRAETAANRALEINPNLGRTYHALAMIRLKNHDWIGAERMLRKGAEISPSNVDLRIALGAVLQTVGRLQDARSEFDRAAALDPVSRLLYELRGTLFLDLGEYELALEALEHLEGRGQGEFALATAYWRLGRETEAEISFRSAAAAMGRSGIADAFLAAHVSGSEIGKVAEQIRSRGKHVPIDFVLLLELGAWEDALEVGNKLFDAGQFVWLWSIWDNAYLGFREHPGFHNFVTQVGFVDYWREFGMADKCEWGGDGAAVCGT